MAKLIIADLSDPKAVRQELRAIVPNLSSVPVQPILLATQEEPGMFDFYKHKPRVLPVHRYADQDQLLADLGDKVIHPAFEVEPHAGGKNQRVPSGTVMLVAINRSGWRSRPLGKLTLSSLHLDPPRSCRF
jgi:hypothetical protein